MKRFFLGSTAVFCALLSTALISAAIYLFRGLGFVAMDGLGDAREMRGDGPQPPWIQDFLFGGWLWFYIPSIVLAVFGLWLFFLFISLMRGAITTSSIDKNAEQGAAANRCPPLS